MRDIEEYFNRIYDATYRDMLRYAVIKTSSPTDAADLVQTVYQRFFERIKKRGTGDIARPAAFLMQIAKRELATHYRAKRAVAEHETELDDGQLPDNTDFEIEVADRLRAGDIWTIVKNCPELSYKVFVLFYAFDMSIVDIAERLELSPGNVKMRLYRVRNRVRSELGGN